MRVGGEGSGGLTLALLSINFVIYVLFAILSWNPLVIDRKLLALYGQYNLLVYRGWYWQLLTSIFLHANLLHILGNSLFLAIFGLRAEGLFTRAQYLLVYFGSGLAGNLLTLLMGPSVVSVGASGAIFGLFGASTMYLRRTMNQSIFGALVYSMYLFILNAGANVNLIAHFGGLVVGLTAGFLMAKARYA